MTRRNDESPGGHRNGRAAAGPTAAATRAAPAAPGAGSPDPHPGTAPGDGRPVPTGAPLVVYYCYGGTHASVVSAALHQGLLDPHRPPAASELARLDFFDRNEREEHGRLLPMGHGPGCDGLFILGAEGAGDALARWCLGLLALAGGADRWLFVNVLTEVNLAMKVAGFASRRLGWRRLARPLLVRGVQAAFPHLVQRVEAARQAVAAYQEARPGGRASPPATASHPGPPGPAAAGPPAPPFPQRFPQRAVFYVSGGSAHRALLAAYLHLGRLSPARPPGPREVAALPGFDRLSPLDEGRIFRVGTDPSGQVVLAAGAGGPDVLALRAAHALRTLGYLPVEAAGRPPGDGNRPAGASAAGEQGARGWRFIPVGDSTPWWARLAPWPHAPGPAGALGPTRRAKGDPDGDGLRPAKPRGHGTETGGHPTGDEGGPGRAPAQGPQALDVGGWRWAWAVRAWTRRWPELAALVAAVAGDGDRHPSR